MRIYRSFSELTHCVFSNWDLASMIELIKSYFCSSAIILLLFRKCVVGVHKIIVLVNFKNIETCRC